MANFGTYIGVLNYAQLQEAIKNSSKTFGVSCDEDCMTTVVDYGSEDYHSEREPMSFEEALGFNANSHLLGYTEMVPWNEEYKELDKIRLEHLN